MANIKIDIRNDGVYIVVDNSDPENKVTRKALLEAIESNNLKQVDYNIVNDILKSEEPLIEKKVSGKADSAAVHENVLVEISRDRLAAVLKFTPPQFGGRLLTKGEIMERIAHAKVTHGISERVVDEAVRMGVHKEYIEKYIVAKGKAPVPGENGELIYNYDMSGEKNQPKILGDGTVDYKQINYFEPISSGDILAYRTPPGAGEPGMDIHGNSISPRPGKPAPKLVKGKNAEVTKDEMQLVATTSGQLVISGKQLGVSPVLDIKGDVDFSTGNIDFEGCVNIAGAVLSGFNVNAAGNIEIRGVVEEAIITAGGSVNLYGGIMGRGKGRVESGNNVFTKFAQNATIISKGNIKSNSLLHSTVTADGSIVLEGDNCFIAGGVIVAGDEVRAKTIGSSMGTMTEVTVGRNNDLAEDLEKVTAEIQEANMQFSKLNEAYEALTKLKKVEEMDNKQKTQLLQLLQQRNAQRDRAVELESEKDAIEEIMKKIRGRIIAEKVIFAGVKVTIGPAYKQLNDDITISILTNDSGMIKARPFM